MNKELFEKIKERILAQPEHFHMSSFIDSEDDEYGSAEELLKEIDISDMKCGTTACIAGWACLLTNSDPREVTESGFEVVAMRVLDIPNDRLFYTDEWPESKYDEFYWTESAQDKARIACEVIDSYIETDGWTKEKDE